MLGKQLRFDSTMKACQKMCVTFLKRNVRQAGFLLLAALTTIVACSLHGDLVLFSVLAYKSYYRDTTVVVSHTNTTTTEAADNPTEKILPDCLQLPDSYNLPDLLLHMAVAIGSAEVLYHSMCGVLQLYFYMLQRDRPEEWKCQPDRFLTPSQEMKQVTAASANLFFTGCLSGFVSCWILNGHYSTVYYRLDDYGYLYFFLSIPGLFCWLEASSFYGHRLLHTPWLYGNVHKFHHQFHAPTAYSSVAMNPFEFLLFQVLYATPLFAFPIHGAVFVAELLYLYYFGLMDHSGVRMQSWLPWQPSTMFHDDHHKYTHYNFGFNTILLDKLHGTVMRTKHYEYIHADE